MILQASISSIRRHIQGPAARGTPFVSKILGILDCGTLAEGPPDLLRVGPYAGPHCIVLRETLGLTD